MNELPEGEFVNDHERSEGDNGRGVIRLKPYYDSLSELGSSIPMFSPVVTFLP